MSFLAPPAAPEWLRYDQVSGETSASGRLASLDAFRGITIAAMLLVNHPGNSRYTYAPLRHASWHGWTPTDLIFPFFLFIVGVSTAFSFGSQLSRGVSRPRILLRAAGRAAILVLIGLSLAAFPWWRLRLERLRIPGVLQRIGVAFLAATPIRLWLRAGAQVMVVVALLLGYWALLVWVPVPGEGAGVLEPGHDLDAYIDRAIFGTEHLWPGQWDPEGLLSTVPAIGTVLLGGLAGDWLRSDRDGERKVVPLVAVGVGCVVLGLAWGTVFPINKNLWTSSFTVFSAGAAMVVLAAFYWLADVRGYRAWTPPLAVLGANAILVYTLASLGDMVLRRIPLGHDASGSWSLRTGLYVRFFESWLSPYAASLAFAVCYLLFWLAVMTPLYRRRISVRA